MTDADDDGSETAWILYSRTKGARNSAGYCDKDGDPEVTDAANNCKLAKGIVLGKNRVTMFEALATVTGSRTRGCRRSVETREKRRQALKPMAVW